MQISLNKKEFEELKDTLLRITLDEEHVGGPRRDRIQSILAKITGKILYGYRPLKSHESLEATDQMQRLGERSSGNWFLVAKFDIGKKASYFRNSSFRIRRPVYRKIKHKVPEIINTTSKWIWIR